MYKDMLLLAVMSVLSILFAFIPATYVKVQVGEYDSYSEAFDATKAEASKTWNRFTELFN